MTQDHVVIECGACGQKNRVAAGRIHDNPVCGRCRNPLAPVASVVEVGESDFRKVVLESPVPVLVDFYASWCGPCRMLAPVLDKASREAAGRIKVVKADVDRCPATAAAFGVTGVPTLIMFSGGRETDRKVGAAPWPEIRSMIDRAAP